MKKLTTLADIQLYDWEGVTREGKRVKGEIQSTSLVLAKSALQKQGVFVKTIHKQSSSFFNLSAKRIKSTDITLFSRQLATMIQAGIPLLQAFDIVSKSQSHLGMKILMGDLKQNVESGSSLADSFRKHPLLFNDLFCNLVSAGETSGSLERMLLNVSAYREKTENIQRKIKKAMLYPSIVIAVGVIVSAVLLIFVVPQFQSLFKSVGASLPMFTLMVVQLSEFFQSYWYIVFIGLIVSTLATTYIYRRSARFREAIDRLALRIPIIGEVLRNAAIARFARTLSITFAAGLPLHEALKLVAGATGNIIFSNATTTIRTEVSAGQSMKQAMESTKLFPNLVVQMVAIGEESGSLEDMLAKVADYYEREVDTTVDNLSTLIEPVIICVLGILVGGLVVAMYLPIFKLGSVF